MLTIQEALNKKAGTTGLTIQEAANKLASISGKRVTTQEALNTLAGVTGAKLTEHEAMKKLAGVTGNYTMQEAANIYATGPVSSYTLFDSYTTYDSPKTYSRLGLYDLGTAKFTGYTFGFQAVTGTAKEFFVVLKRVGTLTGNISSFIYTSLDEGSGPYADAWAANGSTVDASTLPTGETFVKFTTDFSMSAGTTYVFVITYTGGDVNNYIDIAKNSSSPSEINFGYYNGTIWVSAEDTSGIFYAYKQ